MPLLARSQSGDQITKAWQGKAVVCIASGPSVTKEQIDIVRDARWRDLIRVIAVNDNYLIAPFADVLYFADEKWMHWHEAGMPRAWGWCHFTAEQARKAFADFDGQKCTLELTPAREDLYRLRIINSDGLSTNPHGVATGWNSGYQALNIAALSGTETVILIGYDACPAGALKHSFGEHPDGTEVPYDHMRRAMRTMRRPLAELGVSVINCSPGTAIDAFDTRTLREAIESLLPDTAAAAL